MVFQHELHVAPTVLIIAGFREIIRIENTSVERFPGFVGGFGFRVRLQVLDRIIDIKSHVNAGRETTDDELRLYAYTRAETVLHLAFFQIGLAEIGDCRAGVGCGVFITDGGIITIVESVYTCSETEDRHGYPVGCGFESRHAVETVTVLVVRIVVLFGKTRGTDLHRPGFVHTIVELARHIGFRLLPSL